MSNKSEREQRGMKLNGFHFVKNSNWMIIFNEDSTTPDIVWVFFLALCFGYLWYSAG